MRSMNTTGVQDRDLKAAEYLQSLRSLTHELERAMQAIASNALSELEESIDSQQMLSARLGELADDYVRSTGSRCRDPYGLPR